MSISVISSINATDLFENLGEKQIQMGESSVLLSIKCAYLTEEGNRTVIYQL